MFDLEYEAQWENLLKESHIVIANFYEQGESHNERFIKSLDAYSKELSNYPDTIFVRVNKAKYPNIHEKYAIVDTPALMVFHHEQPVKMFENVSDTKGRKTTTIVGNQKDIPEYLKEIITELHIPAKK